MKFCLIENLTPPPFWTFAPKKPIFYSTKNPQRIFLIGNDPPTQPIKIFSVFDMSVVNCPLGKPRNKKTVKKVTS